MQIAMKFEDVEFSALTPQRTYRSSELSALQSHTDWTDDRQLLLGQLLEQSQLASSSSKLL